MDWHLRAGEFLAVHEALHDPQCSEVTVGDHTYKIIDRHSDYKNYREVRLRHGWQMLTQNLSKPSSNTAAVFAARSKGGDLQITWVFDPGGYAARIDTVIVPDKEPVTKLTELGTKTVVYDSSQS